MQLKMVWDRLRVLKSQRYSHKNFFNPVVLGGAPLLLIIFVRNPS